MRPDMPFAAAEMIAVAMAGVAEGETMRLWFDRAVAAQYDYEYAYTSVLWGLLPRWGGSYSRMLAFGAACARTRRFDTAIPTYLNTAVRQIANELPDWRRLLRNAELRKLLIETRLRCLEQASSDEARNYHTSMLLMDRHRRRRRCEYGQGASTVRCGYQTIRLDSEANRFMQELQFECGVRCSLHAFATAPIGRNSLPQTIC
jgi:hypothetical protein